MAKFKDDSGREWTIRIDVQTIKQVKEACDINLGSLQAAPECLRQLADDPILLCNVLFVLCEEQATKASITDSDFGRLLAGDVIDRATMALQEAITDFFPQRKRLLLQRLQKKIDKLNAAGQELVEAKLESPELEEKLLAAMQAGMDDKIDQKLMQLNSFTNLPESSEGSTPAA